MNTSLLQIMAMIEVLFNRFILLLHINNQLVVGLRPLKLIDILRKFLVQSFGRQWISLVELEISRVYGIEPFLTEVILFV